MTLRRDFMAAPWGTLAALAVALLLALSQVAFAERVRPATPETLPDLLAEMQPGDVLLLAAGTYGTLEMKGGGAPANPVILRAEDLADRPVFTRMALRNAHHVVLDGLTFRMMPQRETTPNNFSIRQSLDVTIARSLFEGLRRPDAAGVNRPWGMGLKVDESTDFALFDSEITKVARGLIISRSDRVEVARNRLHGMRVDGMNFAQVTDVLIEGNTIRDFDKVENDEDHRDMIQFWTRGTDRPSENITIRRNILNSGTGPFTQSIFMRNEMVDTGVAGDEMFYRNLVIEENVILNAHLHGITVGATDGLTIQRNTVARNAISQGPDDNPGLWTPRITIDSGARNVLVLGNVTHALPEPGWEPSWVIAGNEIVQDRVPGKRDHYDNVFYSVSPNTPAKLSDFAARPGGLLAGRDVGASLLVQFSQELARTAPEATATAQGAQDLRGVIRYEPERGVIVADGGAGQDPLSLELPDTSLFIGDLFAPVILPVEMSGPLFDASELDLRIRVSTEGSYRGAGEVLRLHQSLRLGITGRGVVELELFSDQGRAARLRSPVTGIFRNGSVDIRVTYDGPDGTVRLFTDGVEVAAKPFDGRLLPQAHWGLSFGNPFGTQTTFEGVIDSFHLRNATTAQGSLQAITDTAFRK